MSPNSKKVARRSGQMIAEWAILAAALAFGLLGFLEFRIFENNTQTGYEVVHTGLMQGIAVISTVISFP